MKRMIKTAIAVATFGLAAAVAAPAVAQSHNPAAVAVTPASDPFMGLLAADGSRDPISSLLGGLLGGGGNPLATVGGNSPLGGADPLGSFGGLTGGIGNPVEQLTGSLGGANGALPQMPASLPGVVAVQPKAPGVLRTSAAQSADVLCMVEAIQAAQAAVPVTICESPVGGMVRDAVHSAAQLATLGKDVTGTHGTLGAVTSGVRQPGVADITQATQFGNLTEGVPALGDRALLTSVKPVAETAEAVAETVAETVAGGKPAGVAVRPALDALPGGQLTSAPGTVSHIVKDVSGLSRELTLDSPAVITN